MSALLKISNTHFHHHRVTRPDSVFGEARIASSPNKLPLLPTGGRRIRLFGIEVIDSDLNAAADWIVKATLQLSLTSVAFVNAHSVNVMNRNVGMNSALSHFSAVFCDGIGVRIAARAAGVDLTDNVNGTDLFPVLCDKVAEAGVPMYLLGSQDGIAAAAANRMCQSRPGLAIAGTSSGFFANAHEEEEAIAAINASGAKILLVGMGVPYQEIWIAKNRSQINVPVVIGVGGLFDYYSGRIARAPLALRRMGLEWAWRLALEPRRLAHRYLVGNFDFLVRLAALRLVAPQQFDQFGLAGNVVAFPD